MVNSSQSSRHAQYTRHNPVEDRSGLSAKAAYMYIVDVIANTMMTCACHAGQSIIN